MFIFHEHEGGTYEIIQNAGPYSQVLTQLQRLSTALGTQTKNLADKQKKQKERDQEAAEGPAKTAKRAKSMGAAENGAQEKKTVAKAAKRSKLNSKKQGEGPTVEAQSLC